MATVKSTSAAAGINITPSIKRSAEVSIGVSTSAPTGTSGLGVPVGVNGAVPSQLGLDRTTLVASEFDGKRRGILGVNAGSVEPPRMIKLTYRPKGAGGAPATATGYLIMAGKGITYDSGGINLKPGDSMHGLMKMDMSGAAAVLGAMSALAALECPSAITGYLMCTDNMPSGSAQKMGDVLTIHGGKTVEVLNTDAEGRLILADALVLAVESDESWHPRGATGFGTRLLLDLALNFTPPAS